MEVSPLPLPLFSLPYHLTLCSILARRQDQTSRPCPARPSSPLHPPGKPFPPARHALRPSRERLGRYTAQEDQPRPAHAYPLRGRASPPVCAGVREGSLGGAWGEAYWYVSSPDYSCWGSLLEFTGFAAETSTFIAECSEDENDMVCREAVNLKVAVESVAGSIQGL